MLSVVWTSFILDGLVVSSSLLAGGGGSRHVFFLGAPGEGRLRARILGVLDVEAAAAVVDAAAVVESMLLPRRE